MQSVSDINLEIFVFLKNLKNFHRNVNKVDDTTIKLLADTIQVIDDVIKDALFVENEPANVDVSSLFVIEEACCHFQRYITCRICYLQVELSEDQYLGHINSRGHINKLLNLERRCGQLAAEETQVIPSMNTDNSKSAKAPTCHKKDADAPHFVLNNGSYDSIEDNIDVIGQLKLSPVKSNQPWSNILPVDQVVAPRKAVNPTNGTDKNTNGTVKNDILSLQTGLAMSNTIDVQDKQVIGALRKFFHDSTITKTINNMIAEANKNMSPVWQHKLESDLKKLLLPYTGTVQCYVNGSRQYGIGTDDRDLNIFVDMGDDYRTPRQMDTMKLKRALCCKILRQNSDVWRDVKDEEDSPLFCRLKAISWEQEARCTFSFGTGIPVEASLFLKEVFTVQPFCRRLVFFLKLWQKYIPGNEFSFNNYTLCLLATCFFQAKELIPSFVSVQDDSAPIGEYNVFSRKIFARPCKQTFPEIVLSFFAFYGFEYNYENHIISPYHGQLIDLNKRDNTTKEDLCMKRTAHFIYTSGKDMWISDMLLQDIFVKRSNVTKNVKLSEVKHFQECCKMSAQLLNCLKSE